MTAENISEKHHWDDYSSLQAGVCLSDAQLHELQRVLTGMLRDIVTVCEKYQLRCFLVGGTALGAMRHGGFIPWDDDIDLAMYREDYGRFISCFEAEFAGRYYIQTPEHTPGYPSLIARVRDAGTVVRCREDLWTDETHSGAWVDIFVIENTFDSKLLRFLHGVLSTCWSGLLACRKTFAVRKTLRQYIIPGSPYARKVRLRSFIGGCFAFLPVDFVRKMANNCNRMCRNNATELVTIPSGHWRFNGETYGRKIFADGKRAAFGDLNCLVPLEVEKYLEHCYGNWRVVPPAGGREIHFFCAFSLDSGAK